MTTLIIAALVCIIVGIGVELFGGWLAKKWMDNL